MKPTLLNGRVEGNEERGVATRCGRGRIRVLIHSRTNQIEDLLPLVDEILRVLETIEPGQIAGTPSFD